MTTHRLATGESDEAGSSAQRCDMWSMEPCSWDQRGDFAPRKPMVGERWSGEAPSRPAARSMAESLFQDPPRATWRWPLVGQELFRRNENFDCTSITLPRQISF